jgi:hypothetical protein
MLPLATLALIVLSAWRGVHPGALLLMAASLALQVIVLTALARASAGGVGAHAEWIRATVTRPRLRRSPAWLASVALLLAGLALALSA